MGIVNIPAKWLVKCDGCGFTVEQTFNNRPAKWMKLRLERDALDYQGAPVADASVERLLCEKCGAKVAEAINASVAKAKKEEEDHATVD
jgi:hypothetical protein